MARPKKGQEHGMWGTPTWISWASMNDRCRRPRFKYYHGRGVQVCPRWKDFRNFLSDMGTRPDGYTLDRIDPNGDYEPNNCRWADRITQARNRRMPAANKSGVLGVWFYEKRGVFKACIHRGGRLIHLGYTPDFFEACCLRKSAEKTL